MQKILMVDDDALMHRLYQQHLERAGFQLLSTSDSARALELAERELPQLIIMDVIMAGMDGLTALRQLKRSETTKSIPVIVVTGSISEHHASRREAMLSGAASFLTKPLSPSQLLAEVRRVVPPPAADDAAGRSGS